MCSFHMLMCYFLESWSNSNFGEQKPQLLIFFTRLYYVFLCIPMSWYKQLTFTEQLHHSFSLFPKPQDHLVCYIPGTLALAEHNGLTSKSYMIIAKNVIYTCYRMYKDMATKLSPEIVHFNMEPGATRDIYVKV